VNYNNYTMYIAYTYAMQKQKYLKIVTISI